MLGLLAALAALQTGCFPRIRQVISNRWHMHQQFHGGGYGGACCTPAFKVPAQAAHFGAPGCCGAEAGFPVAYPGPAIHGPAGTPTIGSPIPLLGTPSPMPSKQ